MAFMQGGLALNELAAHSFDRVSGSSILTVQRKLEHQSKASTLAR